MGYNPEFDNLDTENIALEGKPIVVHNAWTIYGMNKDGTEAEDKMACFERPQDWGHPRYTYVHYRLEFDEGGSHFIHHAHCWTDLKRDPYQMRKMFSPLIVEIMTPGRPGELCGDEYMEDDDFWVAEWGEMPPFFDEVRDDDFDFEEVP